MMVQFESEDAARRAVAYAEGAADAAARAGVAVAGFEALQAATWAAMGKQQGDGGGVCGGVVAQGRRGGSSQALLQQGCSTAFEGQWLTDLVHVAVLQASSRPVA